MAELLAGQEMRLTRLAELRIPVELSTGMFQKTVERFEDGQVIERIVTEGSLNLERTGDYHKGDFADVAKRLGLVDQAASSPSKRPRT